MHVAFIIIVFVRADISTQSMPPSRRNMPRFARSQIEIVNTRSRGGSMWRFIYPAAYQ